MLRRLFSVLASRKHRNILHKRTPVTDVLARARARPGSAEHEAIVAAVRAGRDPAESMVTRTATGFHRTDTSVASQEAGAVAG